MTLYIHKCVNAHVHLYLTLSLFFSPHFFVPFPIDPVALLEKDPSKAETQSVPSSAAVKQDILLPPEGAVTTEKGVPESSKLLEENLTEDKEVELMDVHEDGTQIEGNVLVFLGNAKHVIFVCHTHFPT